MRHKKLFMSLIVGALLSLTACANNAPDSKDDPQGYMIYSAIHNDLDSLGDPDTESKMIRGKLDAGQDESQRYMSQTAVWKDVTEAEVSKVAQLTNCTSAPDSLVVRNCTLTKTEILVFSPVEFRGSWSDYGKGKGDLVLNVFLNGDNKSAGKKIQ